MYNIFRYMERRCKFLDNFPGFCYNTGNMSVIPLICLNLYLHINVGLGAPFDKTQLSDDELKKMVDSKMIEMLKVGYYTKTNKLGEILMETMLQEVSDFCKINIQQNWAIQAHQQVTKRDQM